MTKIAIFISGGGSNMVRLIQDMKSDDYASPAFVLSNVAEAAGVGKAQDLGVQTHIVPFTKDTVQDFETRALKLLRDVDVLCLAGFMRVLSADFLQGFGKPVLNIHPSLLPKFKGLHTHQRALDAGAHDHGCTVHLVTPELDDGPILGQATVRVHRHDTADSLAARVLGQEHILYPKVVREFITSQSGASL